MAGRSVAGQNGHHLETPTNSMTVATRAHVHLHERTPAGWRATAAISRVCGSLPRRVRRRGSHEGVVALDGSECACERRERRCERDDATSVDGGFQERAGKVLDRLADCLLKRMLRLAI